jgi:Glycosyltransferase family 87
LDRTRRFSAHALVFGLLAIGLISVLARVLIISKSIGSNDMKAWLSFATSIDRTSLGEVYDRVARFNHPPLMGFFASWAYSASVFSGLPFEWLFKAPMVLADLASACILYRSWRGRGAARAALVFAAFCCNPLSMLISAYHGNTDSLCASFVLLAAVLMDLRLVFWSGLALASAINVKLIPVLMIVPLWSAVRDRRQALAFGAALALGVVPFLPYLIWHWSGFYEHALAYRSDPRVWGITYLSDRLEAAKHIGNAARAVTGFWTKYGTLAVCGWPLLLAALRRWRGPDFSARELAACTMLGFLAFTPGWGIQYLVYPAALLFSISLERGVWFSTVAGVSAFVMYATLWTGKLPYFSEFRNPQASGRLIACLTWMLGVRLLFDLVRAEKRLPVLVWSEWAAGGACLQGVLSRARRALGGNGKRFAATRG